MLSSAALIDLKLMIDDATSFRRDLTSEIAIGERKLDALGRQLKFAKTFVIRLWTRRRVMRLSEESWTLSRIVALAKAALDKCFVDIDYDLSTSSAESHAALLTAFRTASNCKRIWSITGVQTEGLAALRTMAGRAVERTPVRFGLVETSIIRSCLKPMRLPTNADQAVQIHPTFLTVGQAGTDLALLSFADVEIRFSRLHFIEEEGVPDDGTVIDRTWKWSNKGGGPDKRFKSNYQIPVVLYGELQLRSEAGLDQTFVFSHVDSAEALATALRVHQRAVAQATGLSTSETESAVEGADDAMAMPPLAEPKNFIGDWIAFGLIVILMIVGFNHAGDILAVLNPPAPTPTTTPVAPPVPPAPVHHKARRHRKADATTPAPVASDASPAPIPIPATPGATMVPAEPIRPDELPPT